MKLALTSLFAFTAAASAGFSPVLSGILPRGGQRGTEMEVIFAGQRIGDVQEILCYEPGITISDLKSKDDNNVTAKVTIAPDARLGEYSMRLRTAGGLSILKSFYVGQFPAVEEVEPNNNFDQPQKIELNKTINGVVKSEDEDFFLVSLKKGQRISVEVEGMRLGRTLFDTYVAILDPKRFEIAASDDTALLKADSFVSAIAPEDGDYRVVVRESAYEGSDACQYRLHIGTFPRPTAVYPLGGKPGETLEFNFVGDPSGVIKKSVTLPANAVSPFPIFPEHDGLMSPSPHWITVSPLEHVAESGANQELKAAVAMPPIPSAAHGVLSEPQKSDWFKFAAKKGDALVLQVVARELRSPVDSVLSLYNSEGKKLAGNDDSGGTPDSKLPWACQADGEYFIEISDQLKRGGADFSYRVEVVRKTESITASLPTVERNNSQKWKTISVAKGNRYAAVVNVAKQNIACDVLFEAASLPPGITMHRPPVPKNVTSFPVIFEAAADAPLGSAFTTFKVSSTGENVPAVSGPLLDTIAHIEINNQGTYHGVTLDKVATAVVNEMPFKLELETPAAPLVKDGIIKLKVTVARAADYKEPISVRFLWNPPGISAPVNVEIPGDKSEAIYELNASAEAAAGDWPVCVLAEAKAAAGPVLISSGFATLKVSDPMVALAFDLAATEQGRPVSMVGKIDKQQDFEGNATVELVGLPHGVKCPPQTFTKDQTEVTFPLEIAVDAAVGKHNAIFCKVNVPVNGQMVIHQTAKGSTLRIDKPAAPVVAKADAQKPAAAAPAPAAGEKPLSRLEQLRQKSQ
ncbi:PPC domain-containing protein [Luteolibacter sp. SL250]|uniref:PPC domain-containing protein n=1 Tax=Luteolibacter sp. SL250 TaxID=2995170 RepID=UPI00226E523F|nr:PPC domain-containing protein [Luteolibacter sp. SL250]WAC17909.1 PPC domain-containing protein [Luteolibacter sp. SL250]